MSYLAAAATPACSFKASALSVDSQVKVGSVRDMEMNLILDTLRSVNGNRTQAASVLGITVRTLRNKIREYKGLGIAVPQGVLNAAN